MPQQRVRLSRTSHAKLADVTITPAAAKFHHFHGASFVDDTTHGNDWVPSRIFLARQRHAMAAAMAHADRREQRAVAGGSRDVLRRKQRREQAARAASKRKPRAVLEREREAMKWADAVHSALERHEGVPEKVTTGKDTVALTISKPGSRVVEARAEAAAKSKRKAAALERQQGEPADEDPTYNAKGEPKFRLTVHSAPDNMWQQSVEYLDAYHHGSLREEGRKTWAGRAAALDTTHTEKEREHLKRQQPNFRGVRDPGPHRMESKSRWIPHDPDKNHRLMLSFLPPGHARDPDQVLPLVRTHWRKWG